MLITFHLFIEELKQRQSYLEKLIGNSGKDLDLIKYLHLTSAHGIRGAENIGLAQLAQPQGSLACTVSPIITVGLSFQ